MRIDAYTYQYMSLMLHHTLAVSGLNVQYGFYGSMALSLDSFQEVKVTVPVNLHPSRFGNVKDGVEEHLNQYLMQYVSLPFGFAHDSRYIAELEGIVLCYRRYKVKAGSAAILHNHPFANFNVDVIFLLFTPNVGHTMGLYLR